jgi:hypothetical protein
MNRLFAVSKRIGGFDPDFTATAKSCGLHVRGIACCAMRRLRAFRFTRHSRAVSAALAVLLTSLLCGSVNADAPSFGTPLRWPLTSKGHALRGGFGETRSNHFHAGLDLSTAQRVGAPVLAPAVGTIERVRASGVGYGRSLYLRLTDGRLVVYGHLDAFEPRLAAWVDSVQRVTTSYEQDLWPESGRFTYATGDVVAWSGESGAGPPHLHVEVRHGDFGLNPLMAGFAVPDTVDPVIETLVLEPLDERSFVQRRAAPLVHRVRASADTLLVEGRVRLAIVASDATNEARGLPVRRVGATWNGQWVECRMDSISWAGEMSQIAWLLDRGRITGSGGVILDAPPRFRPRFLATSRPDTLATELVTVLDGAAPRELRLVASDAAGNETVRRVWLRGPRWNEVGPDTRGVTPTPKPRRGAAVAAAEDPRWTFATLPDQRVRVSVRGTPPGLRAVRIERGGSVPETSGGVDASWDGESWSAVLNMTGTPDPDGLWIKGRLADGKAWWHRGAWSLWATGTSFMIKQDEWAWCAMLPEQVLENDVVMVRTLPIGGLAAGASPVRAAFEILPATMPVRKPITIWLRLPAGMSRDRLGMYRRDDSGDAWEWADGVLDSVGGAFHAEATRFGQFAVLRDEAAPEVTLLATPGRGSAGPYSRWAFEARVIDRTSGVAGRKCSIRVDGKAVPAEWDAESKVLRWRPLQVPAKGKHEVVVEAVDRVGNRTVRTGSFVIVSR